MKLVTFLLYKLWFFLFSVKSFSEHKDLFYALLLCKLCFFSPREINFRKKPWFLYEINCFTLIFSSSYTEIGHQLCMGLSYYVNTLESTLESKVEWVESISYDSPGVSRVENVRLTLNTSIHILAFMKRMQNWDNYNIMNFFYFPASKSWISNHMTQTSKFYYQFTIIDKYY